MYYKYNKYLQSQPIDENRFGDKGLHDGDKMETIPISLNLSHDND